MCSLAIFGSINKKKKVTSSPSAVWQENSFNSFRHQSSKSKVCGFKISIKLFLCVFFSCSMIYNIVNIFILCQIPFRPLIQKDDNINNSCVKIKLFSVLQMHLYHTDLNREGFELVWIYQLNCYLFSRDTFPVSSQFCFGHTSQAVFTW